MFQGHPPLPPPASLPVRFAITDLHRETLLYSDLAVQFLSLSLFFLFYSFRPFLDRSFFAFFDSFARALLSDFVIALITRFFIEGRGERGKIKSIFVDLLFFFSKSSQTRNTWHFSKNWNFIYAKRPRGK